MRIREQLDGDYSRGGLTERYGEGPTDRIQAVATMDSHIPKLEDRKIGNAGREIKRLRVLVRQNAARADIRAAIRAIEKVVLEEDVIHELVSSVDRFFLTYIAIKEWMDPKCRTCNGVRFMQPPGMARIDCLDCDATGLHRYGAKEREKLFGKTLLDNHKRYLTATTTMIRHVDMLTDEGAKKKLRG